MLWKRHTSEVNVGKTQSNRKNTNRQDVVELRNGVNVAHMHLMKGRHG